MTHSADSIITLMQRGDTLDLRAEDGTIITYGAVYEHIRVLAQAGVITAKGSPTSLRYATLHVPVEEAEQIIQGFARERGEIRAATLTTAASRTVVSESIIGETRSFRSWTHITKPGHGCNAYKQSWQRLHTHASKAL